MFEEKMQITTQITSNTCITILTSDLTVVGIIHTGNNAKYNFVISLHTLFYDLLQNRKTVA